MGFNLPLLNRRRRGGTALDAYGVLGFNPELVFDFGAEYYRTSGAVSTFSDSLTATRSSNATMVDSDGLLKWAPHNLLVGTTTLTGGFSLSGLESLTGSATDGFVLQPTTTNAQHALNHVALAVSAASYTYEIEAKANGYNFIGFNSLGTPSVSNDLASVNLSDGTTASQTGVTITATSMGDGWYRIKYVIPYTASGTGALAYVYVLETSQNFNPYVGDGASSILVRNPRFYRSDLGGMAPVPADARVAGSETYVPTTSAAVYLPRRGHHIWNGSAWVKAGLLVEPSAATNLITYSNTFSDVSWLKVGSTISAGTSESPDGTVNASKIVENSATSEHLVGRTLIGTGQKAASAFFKAAGRTQAAIYFFNAIDGVSVSYFDLSLGTVISGTGTIESVGNGWYRCTHGRNATISDNVYFCAAVGSNTNYTGDGTSGVLIYGAQLEAGSVPSSYIPTAGATATRAAETLTVAAADLPYSATAMSIQMDGFMTYADTNSGNELRWLQWGSGSNPTISAYLRTTSARTGNPTWQQVASVTTTITGSDTAYSPGINVPFNIASRHGSTFINGAVDGVALTADLTPTALPDLSATNLSLAYSGGPMVISKFRMWGEDLGDTGIATATGAAPVITGVPTIGVS